MPKKSLQIWIYSIAILLLSACGGYEKVLKSDDVNYKLTKANEYFDKRQYQRANTLYESLIPVMRGTKNYEALYFKYAYSAYYLKDYIIASYHFKNFIDYFPGSKDAEEAEYMYAVSLYKMAPKATLEQTNTVKAMEALQSYMNTHPDSKRLTEANKMMDEMRIKLEEKEAGAAKLYYNMGQYKAASIAYKAVMQNYPESANSDYYQYMVMRSLYNYARQSIADKQEERFANAMTAYQELKDEHPKSIYIQEADKLNSQANQIVKQLRNEHQ